MNLLKKLPAILIILIPLIPLFIVGGDLILGRNLRSQEIKVGSKIFTESYILADMFSILLESEGYKVNTKSGLGGTSVVFEALLNGDIDIYPEYTGTISEISSRSWDNTKAIGKKTRVLKPIGFNNTYALAVTREFADKNNLRKITDLVERFPSETIAINHEFYERKDGWKELKKAYKMNNPYQLLDHGVIYESVKQGVSKIILIYSTDPKIKKFNLKILKDDRDFFPKYDAVAFIRADFPPRAIKIISRLTNQINDELMVELNSMVELDGLTSREVAMDFLLQRKLIHNSENEIENKNYEESAFLRRLKEHLFLVFVSLFFAIILGLPVGYGLFYYNRGTSFVLGVIGLMQTIPGLALVVLMIPFTGLGTLSALIALFIYSLLPIVRNTYVAFSEIRPEIHNAAFGIGMNFYQKLFWIEFPLALPVILTGVRTAGVISIGTATLATLIGAGGLGEPIIIGLTMADMDMVLYQGALPAMALAICFELGFNLLEKSLFTWKTAGEGVR